jgi:cobalamin biosynthesis protein CobD/CbiB
MMALALAIDAVLGWPDRLYARIGHPVTWIGRLISAVETRWNRGGPKRRRVTGAFCVLAVTAAAVLPALAVQSLLPSGPLGLILGAILAWPLVAARSLHDHVAAVARPLAAGDLAGARVAVSMIVGRDPARLTGLAIALASGRPRAALRVMTRDARRHRSPNAGWPEAAMAGALGIRLSGPRIYGDRVADEPWLNAGAADPAPYDLKRGLALYARAMVLCGAGLIALALI